MQYQHKLTVTSGRECRVTKYITLFQELAGLLLVMVHGCESKLNADLFFIFHSYVVCVCPQMMAQSNLYNVIYLYSCYKFE